MKRLAWLMLLGAIFLLVVACGDDDDDDSATDDDAGDDDDDDDDDDVTDDDDTTDDDVGDDDDDDDGPPDFDGILNIQTDIEGNVILGWQAAIDEDEPITYNVYVADEMMGQDFSTPNETTQELEITVGGLETCATWYFIVRAQDALGNEDDNEVEQDALPVSYNCGYTGQARVAWTFTNPNGAYDIQTAAWIDDLDGDDVPDIVVESFDDYNYPTDEDHLFAVSGTDGEIIWSARPANAAGSISGGWGDKGLAVTPDISGDGAPDVLFGTAWGSRSAFAIDGMTGDTLWYFDTYAHPESPGSGWVYQLAAVPDVTGDGVYDVAFVAGSSCDAAFLVDGATGDFVWRKAASDSLQSIAVLRDVNGDDLADVVLGAGDSLDDRVYVVSGASTGEAQVIWSQENNTSVNYSLAVIEDITNDGRQEVVAAVWSSYTAPGRLIAHDGQTGGVVWTYSLSSGSPMRVANLGDVSGDGYEDLLLCASNNGYAMAISGFDGTELWKAEVPNANSVWACDKVDDITGDGIADAVAGGFTGTVAAYNGVTGDLLWSYDTGDHLIRTVRGIPDVTGDCVPDVIAGTQDGPTPGSGTLFVLHGCP